MKKYIPLLLNMILTTLIQAESLPVLFGTSPGKNNGSKGIYAATMNTATGKLSGDPDLVAELVSPGFQVLHPTLPVVYSIGATLTDNEAGIFSYSLKRTNDKLLLEPINHCPTDAGRSTHLDVDPSGRILVCVQYGDATVSVFPLNSDGSLQPTTQTIRHTRATNADPQRQDKPHPHNVTFDPSGKYALVPDLGADMVYVYKVDYKNKRITLHDEVKTARASGPRHMKFSGDGKNAYVLNELSLTVDAFTWDAKSGKMSHLATVDGLPGKLRSEGVINTASEIRIHPGGRFLYTANRGHNSISVFSIHPESKIPELVEVVSAKVDWPRNFALDPNGNWLISAGQYSNDVAVFSVNKDSGRLTFLKDSIRQVPGPICVTPVTR